MRPQGRPQIRQLILMLLIQVGCDGLSGYQDVFLQSLEAEQARRQEQVRTIRGSISLCLPELRSWQQVMEKSSRHPIVQVPEIM